MRLRKTREPGSSSWQNAVWASASVLAIVTWVVPASAATDWTTAEGYRWRALEETGGNRDGFTRLESSATGVTFQQHLGEEAGAANRVLYNGAGVAVGDVDGDGLPDVFFCSLSGTNALYRNRGGWRFENVTEASGLAQFLPESRGATFADLDGDGSLDLLVTVNGRGVRLFRNDGAGRFSDATEGSGLESRAGGTTLAVADVDGNGTLDVYVTHYRPDDIRDRGRVNLTMVNGQPVLRGETNRLVMVAGKLEENGQADQLFLNGGNGRFSEVSWTGGRFLDDQGKPLREAPLDWGLCATFRDVNGDGHPDLYVCNDYWTPDRFWWNDGKGSFRAVPATSVRKTPASSMSVDFADINRDGHLDFFAVDMLSRDPRMRKRQMLAQTVPEGGAGTSVALDRAQVLRNTLCLNRGDGTFSETAYQAGIEATDWSWSALFLDVDLDGYEDLLVGAGHFRDVQDFDAERQVRARQRSWSGFPTESARQRAYTRELMEHYRLYPFLRLPIGGFKNAAGSRFEEKTASWGLDQAGVHQGMALADLDGNGSLDLVVNGLNAEAAMFRNETRRPRVAVRLVGKAPNRGAIGARVTLRGGVVSEQMQEWVCGGRYLSGSDPMAVFAAGEGVRQMSIEVRWRDGGVRRIEGVVAGRLYEIVEGSVSGGSETKLETRKSPEDGTWFEDVSDRVRHRHEDNAYDDVARQPLLPWKLSQAGPGLAWFDVDGDGKDDLVSGNGRGGALGIFLGDGKGAFRPGPGGSSSLADDALGLVGWVREDGKPSVLVAHSGYETVLDHAGVARAWADGVWREERFGEGMTGGEAVAVGDPMGDGRWALFIGGGVVPGQYPRGAASRLYRRQSGAWRLDGRNGVLLENLGIVHGAQWSDLDGDGVAELVLACEWGPVRVFRWRGERLVEQTAALGLAEHRGFWRGVATGDLNEDGRLDLVVSNWGLNTPYRASSERPLTLAFGELAQPGVMEVVETEYVDGQLAPRAQLATLLPSLPFLSETFPTHRQYSEATLEQVLGERSPLVRKLSVTTLTSMVFLSDGERYRALPLPEEAQRSPGFGVSVGDWDGDGHDDVMLAQNFSQVRPEMGRLDAGLGLWLRGDGKGGLTAVPPSESGLRIYGDQRGLAAGDFDQDGRWDLAIAQNGGETKLFRNRRGQPGIRIRITGPSVNPRGYGVGLRARRGGVLGPRMEVRGGGGYLSQDSVVRVLGGGVRPESVSVLWPGGLRQDVPIGAEDSEVNVRRTE